MYSFSFPLVIQLALAAIIIWVSGGSSALAGHRESGVIVKSPTPVVDGELLFDDYYFVPDVTVEDFPANFSQEVFPNTPVQLIEPIQEAHKEAEPVEGQRLNWGLDNLNVDAFRVIATKTNIGRRIRVAVVDTGGCLDHPDLRGIYKQGYNAFFPGSPAKDDHGHGCHVTGTIAGNPAYGVAKGFVDVFPAKFLGADGSGDIVGAIKSTKAALDWGAEIVSNSWGGGGTDDPYAALVSSAIAKGVIFVNAAGNDGAVGPSFPADLPGVISVAAHTRYNQKAYFSNYGPKVLVSAPGMSIYSTWLSGQYNTISGTSMATPHVTAVAALLLSSGLSPKAVKTSLNTVYAVPANWVSKGRIFAKTPTL